MRIALLSLLFIISSCSTWDSLVHKNSQEYAQNYSTILQSDKDYLDQLAVLSQSYRDTQKGKIIEIPASLKGYFQKINAKIFSSNYPTFKGSHSFNFYVIKSEYPFYFSAPGDIYFSTALVTKYLKTEELFVAVLTIEIVQSLMNVFPKKKILPLGSIETEAMINIVKLPLNQKISVNAWAFYLLRRADYDPFVVLNWIQILNRNALDFQFLIGDVNSINNEEMALKDYITKNRFRNESKFNQKISSIDYSKLMKYIERQ